MFLLALPLLAHLTHLPVLLAYRVSGTGRKAFTIHAVERTLTLCRPNDTRSTTTHTNTSRSSRTVMASFRMASPRDVIPLDYQTPLAAPLDGLPPGLRTPFLTASMRVDKPLTAPIDAPSVFTKEISEPS